MGRKVFNTHQIEVIKPSGLPEVWGPTGRFPVSSEFLGGFFDPVEVQLDLFLAWYRQHYLACLHRKPTQGHAMFIVGPTGAGKTFFSRGFVGKSLGGFAEANVFMNSGDNHYSEMFDYGLWVMDDGSISATDREGLRYSENVKRIVANSELRCNEKFRKAFLTQWMGRFLCTLNRDTNSLRLIPNQDISMGEKMIVLAAGDRKFPFPIRAEMEKIMDRELPHFLQWLIDWRAPDHCFKGAENRFGVRHYAHPSIMLSANLSSGRNTFSEILIRWLTLYFEEQAPTAETWEGTATDLRMSMCADSVFAEVLRNYKPDSIPGLLTQAMNKKTLDITVKDDPETGTRIFIIRRDHRFKKYAVKQTEPPP